MAFKSIGTLTPYGGPVLRSEIVTDSVEVTELDAMEVASGFLALGTSGDLIFGHVMAIVTYDGVGMTSDGAGGSYSGTYTMASDNETVLKYKATCDISKHTLYSVVPDAAIATTTGSNLLGYHTDIADEDETDENTATTATAQYTIHGVDPLVSANQIVNIYESVIYGV